MFPYFGVPFVPFFGGDLKYSAIPFACVRTWVSVYLALIFIFWLVTLNIEIRRAALSLNLLVGDFWTHQAIDQVVNSAAKQLYMSAGNSPVPVVFRGPNGAAAGVGKRSQL